MFEYNDRHILSRAFANGELSIVFVIDVNLC
jgi:hypothetical protein